MRHPNGRTLILKSRNKKRVPKVSYDQLSDLAAEFPVWDAVHKVGVIKGKSLIYDHSLNDMATLTFNLFDKLFSRHDQQYKTEHFRLVLNYLKEIGGFHLFKTVSDHTYDGTHDIIIINDKIEMVVKIGHVANIKKNKPQTELDDYEGDPEFIALLNMDNVGSDNASSSKDSLELAFAPTVENYKIVEKFATLFPEEKADETSVYLFEKSPSGAMHLVPHPIQKFELNLEDHYNDDFIAADAKIMEWVADNDPSSINKKLVLLHGIAGAGKTNYVKNLMGACKNIKVIYIPPYYIDALGDPAFFSFIQKYKGSLLLIEDAEKVLVSREGQAQNSGISILLNLTDGILASVLNFKIICTFNTDEKEIDSALKRKGRLFLRYKFDLLNEKKTKSLYQKLYQKDPPSKEMSLANIFEADDNGVDMTPVKDKVMGFIP